MQHGEVKFYKVYVNENPGLILTYLSACSCKVKYGNIGSSIRKSDKQWLFQKLVQPVTWKLVDGDKYTWH